MTVPLHETPRRELHPAPALNGEGGLLVELPGTELAALSKQVRALRGETLRFCWLDETSPLALVYLESCPLLLLERLAEVPNTRLYHQQATGIWVQRGYRYAGPPPEGDFWLLLDVAHSRVFSSANFHQLQPTLLSATTALPTHTVAPTSSVQLRLVPTTAGTEVSPRLWLLYDDALTQLANYARTTNELLLQRFQVALSSAHGKPFVVLRATNTKGPPPVFVGATLALQPYLRLPNVYVPVGLKIAPQVRRETLRTLLGDTTGKVTWLRPTDAGRFQVEVLPENAFRPLAAAVDYRVSETQHRQAWEQAHRWDFEPFVEVMDIPKPTPRSAPSTSPTLVPSGPGIVARAVGWLTGRRGGAKKSKTGALKNTRQVPESIRTTTSQADRLHLARPETNNHAVERCQQLESQLLELLPAKATERPSEQWAELASAYDSVGNDADAALCWLHALWNETQQPAAYARGWLRAEAKATRMDLATLEPALWLTTSNPAATRALAAWVVCAGQQHPVPVFLHDHATQLQARLEADEHWLPVRAVWLARSALARQTGNQDVLGLTRTRDRLFARLHQNGLSVELDAPSFIRYAGDGMRDRFHEARRWLTDKHELIQQWLQQLTPLNRFTPETTPTQGLYTTGLEANIPYTQAYASLVFAWGLLRFSHVVAAETFRKQATDNLPVTPVHTVLREAFEYRLQQLRDSKPTRGPLPGSWLAKLGALNDTEQYIVNKLREQSRIIDPEGHVEAYKALGIDRTAYDRPQSLQRATADHLNQQLQILLGREQAGRLPTEVLLLACERAAEIHPEIVAHLGPSITKSLETLRTTPRLMVRFLEKGFAACLVWDRVELAPLFANGLRQLLDGWTSWDFAEGLTGQAVRCLRRFGLKDEAEQLLNHIAHVVLQGQTLAKVRAQRPKDWPTVLRVLLNVACGWYFAGHDEQAHAILDAARTELFAGELSTTQSTSLAFSYTNALAYAPVRVALGRLEELFQRLKRIHIAGTTNACFALKPLMLVETAVRVVVSDDFTMGVEVRSWLDADEFAVRRRINHETKTMLQDLG